MRSSSGTGSGCGSTRRIGPSAGRRSTPPSGTRPTTSRITGPRSLCRAGNSAEGRPPFRKLWSIGARPDRLESSNPRSPMTRALLVYPEFRSASFWNYRETCELVDARYPAAPLGLCTVAALLPPDWEVKLVDRNIEEWNDSMLDEADVVLTGGMMPQQRDCIELIRKARAKGKMVIVGGPNATSSPHLYGDASHLVLGESEVTMPTFLADLKAGTPKKIYTDPQKADVQKSP